MTFARRFPAHLLPQVEAVLAHLLHGVGEGEWEIVIVPVGLPKQERRKDACPECGSTKAHFCPGKHGMPSKIWSGESDEQPVITPEEQDE